MASKGSGTLLSRLLRVGLLALFILVIFLGTALAAALVTAWWDGNAVTERGNLYLGIICGLVAWCFVVVFHIKRDTLELPIQGRGFFLERARTQLEQLGYEVTAATDMAITGTPGFHALLFGGAIEIRTQGRTATLRGPKVYLERLRKYLRMQSQVEQVQQAVIEMHRRQGERRLFRVQISLRVSKEHWDDVYDELISVLAAEGAVVTCDITLSAQSGPGIREGTVEEMIRPWLEKQGLPAEIRKEEVEQQPEPV